MVIRVITSVYCESIKAEKKIKLKNGVFWDDTPCGSCKNRRFEGI
jgi:hypothetical protein